MMVVAGGPARWGGSLAPPRYGERAMDRVAFVTICWFVFWTGAGILLGRYLEVPGTFTVTGFIFALLTVFAWPWILPESLNRWMDY
jgi:hypothetical protein